MKDLLLGLWRLLPPSRRLQLFLVRLLHDEFLVGTVGIIFNDKDEVLLFRHTYRSESWGLPGGYMQAGEHPKETLEREIAEESGLTVAIDQPLTVRTDRSSARLEIALLGTFIGGTFKKSPEVDEANFFPTDHLPPTAPGQSLIINDALIQRKQTFNSTKPRFGWLTSFGRIRRERL